MIVRTISAHLGPVRRLTAAEERDLAGRRAELGPDAWRAAPERRELIVRNYPLALKLAGEALCHSPLGEDVVGVAMLALCRAADGFDPGRGCRFSTYATRVIVNDLRRTAMVEAPLVYVPEAVQCRLRAGPDAGPPRPGEEWAEAALPMARVALSVASLHPRPGEPYLDPPDPRPGEDGDEGTEARVRAAVDALPPAEAAVVRLYYLAGPGCLRTPAIGKILGLNKETIARRLRVALRRLARDLAPGREVAS